MKKPTIFVIGDYIQDEFIYGTCSRISPEAPVPVVLESKREIKSGGAGNVEENLRALGAEVISWYGGKKSRKMRIIAGHQQVCRLDNDDCTSVSPPENLEKVVAQSDAILIADYNKGVVNFELINALDRVLDVHKVPLLIDPYRKKNFYGRHVTLIKPNKMEAESLSWDQITDHESLIKVGENYLDTIGAENVVITLGEGGMALFDREKYLKNPFIVPTKVQQVFDVTGAGDTALAVLGFIWATGVPGKFSKQAAVTWANEAAGIVVGKLGTATVSFTELFGEE